jgi:hypothetical protein
MKPDEDKQEPTSEWMTSLARLLESDDPDAPDMEAWAKLAEQLPLDAPEPGSPSLLIVSPIVPKKLATDGSDRPAAANRAS